ncbi:ABC transporter permease [Endozoicomonas sp. Mp262]|uniref:ABC transporter permease n=1 Tax=Endozoicomonas sp. Mp262 TaxID=2919499 RepID=UPI0021D93EEA
MSQPPAVAALPQPVASGNNTPFWHKLYPYRHKLGTLSLLVILWLLFLVMSPETFGSSRIYLSLMTSIPFPAILALALTLMVVAGEVDMSFPAIMAFSSYIFAVTFEATGVAGLGLVAALVVGGGAGLLNALLVVRLGVPSIIATIGAQFFWYGLATLLANGIAISMVEIRETLLNSILTGRLFGWLPMQAVWCLILAVAGSLLLHRHHFGDNIRFIGDNQETARMMGVATDKTRTGLFVLVGAVSALVGVMVCNEMGSWWPTQGEGYMLLVFASVFIGGTSVFGGEGTLSGTLIGAIVIGMIEAGIIAGGLSGFWTRMVYGLIIIASVSGYAVIFKKQGQ